MHHDPVAQLVLWLALILASAKLGGHLAVRLKQPAVLGELLGGVLLGNLPLIGVSALVPMQQDATIDMIARLGVIVLLFEVGLESTVGQMLKVGATAVAVAVVGVVAPAALGFLVAHWLLPAQSVYTHAFIGTILCATSVGITARVLKDLGASQLQEAKIILGAAVIDDVLGLIVLAVVSGVIVAAGAGGTVAVGDIAWIFGKASLFLVGALVLGVLLTPRLFRAAAQLKSTGVLLATGLSLCFFLSWAADRIGLAPLVGAFAAGLILEELHYSPFQGRANESRGLEDLVHPISQFLVPVFFVLMGMRTDLQSFASGSVLALAAALVVAAVVGKQLCALAVRGAGVDRMSIGIGMIPRGEVGLIFAGMGQTLLVQGVPVVTPAIYAACVVMVMVTTMITPPALAWSLRRGALRTPAPAA